MNRRFAIQLGFATFGIGLMAVAFLRGNALFGVECGLVYVGITAGILWILGRSFTNTERPLYARAAIVIALAVPVGFAMAFPASINHDVQHVIDLQATDRAAQAELAALLASDPAYGDLSASTSQLKVVNVTIQGSLKAHSDLDRLRDQIKNRCHTLRYCMLHWVITLRESGQRIEVLDSQLIRYEAKTWILIEPALTRPTATPS